MCILRIWSAYIKYYYRNTTKTKKTIENTRKHKKNQKNFFWFSSVFWVFLIHAVVSIFSSSGETHATIVSPHLHHRKQYLII
jgi:hypothetical protein